MSDDDILKREEIKAGDVFIKEGEDGKNAYVIQSGSVRVFKNEGEKQVDLAELGPGNIIGEVALILDEPRVASIQAKEDTTLIVITRENFEEKLKESDSTVRSVLKLLSHRLKAQNVNKMRAEISGEEIDAQAAAIMRSVAKDLPEDKQLAFIDTIMPHMDHLIRALKSFKSE